MKRAVTKMAHIYGIYISMKNKISSFLEGAIWALICNIINMIISYFPADTFNDKIHFIIYFGGLFSFALAFPIVVLSVVLVPLFYLIGKLTKLDKYVKIAKFILGFSSAWVLTTLMLIHLIKF